jgi:hypothetical protein
MEKETLKAILFWVLVLSIAIALNSCGTRKVTTSLETMEQKELVTNQSDLTFELDNRRYVYTATDDLELVPVDNSKPMIVNGKSYWNAKFKRSKSQTTDSSKVAIKSQDKSKAVSQKQISTKTKDKNTDRKTYWGLIVGAVIFGISFIYLKRYFK